MKPEQKKNQHKNVLVLSALGILFVGPILAAYLLNVFAPDWLPFGQTHHGILLQPARKLDDDAVRAIGGTVPAKLFHDTWTLVYVANTVCSSRCQLSLVELRQAKIALGKEMHRLRQILLLRPDPLPSIKVHVRANPELTVGVTTAGWDNSLAGATPVDQSYILLVDPQGYAVMRYAADIDSADVLKDLKRLLKISKIG